jgi:hypothetical protein
MGITAKKDRCLDVGTHYAIKTVQGQNIARKGLDESRCRLPGKGSQAVGLEFVL